MAWMVIRVRGSIHARHDIVQTLENLHLTRPNHATLLPEAPSMRGMLTAVQGYVTWGEAEPETVQLLLSQRGERVGGARLSEGSPEEGEIARMTKTMVSQGMTTEPGVKPLFRLRAPKGGWRSTKKPFALGGALGYRGRAINDLARKML
ncbi:MAG: 50S ribosomal protein L30 [Thermoplasmata archaeon]|nr:50S ribosomal protein L30 [Thermoplasmata archaeon]